MAAFEDMHAEISATRKVLKEELYSCTSQYMKKVDNLRKDLYRLLKEARVQHITNDNGSSLSSIKEQTAELSKNFRNTNITNKVEVEIKRLDYYLNNIGVSGIHLG